MTTAQAKTENPLKTRLMQAIDSLTLGKLEKQFLCNRWLDQLVWMDKRATSKRNYHYLWRLIAIVGGVLVPALVNLKGAWINSLVTIVSLMVAISVAVEEFYKFGEDNLRYRGTAEMLQSIGWAYFELVGPYRDFKTHDGEAFKTFVEQVQMTLHEERTAFIRQRQDNDQENDTDQGRAQNQEKTDKSSNGEDNGLPEAVAHGNP